MVVNRLPLGQLLVDARMISGPALEEALAIQESDGRRLGTLLLERGYINETQLTQILSHQLSVPWVSLLHIEFSRQLLNLVPHDVAERYCLVPIYVRHVRGQGETLYVAMDDPTNEEGLRDCGSFSGLPVRPMIAPPSDIRSAIRVYYGGASMRPGPPPEAAMATPPRVPDLPRVPKAPHDPDLLPISDRTTVRVSPSESSPNERIAISDMPSIETTHLSRPHASQTPLPVAPPVEAGTRVLAATAPRARSEPPIPEPPPSSPIPPPKGRAPRMVNLTLLDGTTITLPARRKKQPASPAPSAKQEGGEHDEGVALTARDLVAALRAISHGADASEILGGNARWEPLFAALLSLLLKKHLIADWEFVDEFKKI